jgi:hypothetical protein
LVSRSGVREINISSVGGFPTFRHGVLSHVKVIHGTFILSSTIRRRPCRATLASLRNQQSIAFVNVSQELNGSMFADRQKLHRDKLVTSAASEEYSYSQGNPPNQPKSGANPHSACRRSGELRVQAEIQVESRGSYSFPGCNFLVRSHIVWPESDIHREQNSEISSKLGMTCDKSL